MIVEAFENYARFNGPWLQGWADMNSAAIASARIAFGQVQLASLTSQFMTQRMRAYADYDGRIEPLVQRLDQLTERFGEDYARELRDIYSSWHEVLRQDRPAPQTTSWFSRGSEDRANEPRNGGKREAKRGERAAERAAH